jgi:hypothetical protein
VNMIEFQPKGVPARQNCVYFLLNPRTCEVKIGFTSDLNARMSSLKSGAGSELSLIRLIDGGRATEKWLHRRFAHLRRSGEWFSYHDDMLSIVAPDEIPVIKTVTKRRDVRLTVSEKITAVESLAADIGVGPKSQLLMMMSELTEEQAGEVLQLIKASARAVRKAERIAA